MRDRLVSKLLSCLAAALSLLTLGAAPAYPAAGPGSRCSEVLVFAAVSLRDALRSVATELDARREGARLVIHAGASGLLARQIERGAPADLFLSADVVEIDRLDASGSLRDGSRATFASNRLVIAVSRNIAPPAQIGDLVDPRFDRIGIGNPRTVPAGRYADRALRTLGLRELLGPRLIFAENVRQVLDYVVRGETAAGLVYRTDARLAAGAIIVGPEPPSGSYGPIVYEAAVPSAASHPGAAIRLIGFLRSPGGQAILSRFGFLPAPAP